MFYNFQIVKVREDYNLQLQENIEKRKIIIFRIVKDDFPN